MTSHLENIAGVVADQLGQVLERIPSTCGELTFEVTAAQLLSAAATLREHPALRFEMLIDLCGIDYLDYGKVEWQTTEATDSSFSRGVQRGPRSAGPAGRGRFAVVYHLLSVSNNVRLRLRAFCEDEALPVVDSVTGIWASANWFEREAFDLFGIMFVGHPDLRRILTDYGFIGHPFRKDFPLVGNVEVRYDPDKGRVVYQPVSIEPRTLVPRVIREDHRYQSMLKESGGNG